MPGWQRKRKPKDNTQNGFKRQAQRSPLPGCLIKLFLFINPKNWDKRLTHGLFNAIGKRYDGDHNVSEHLVFPRKEMKCRQRHPRYGYIFLRAAVYPPVS